MADAATKSATPGRHGDVRLLPRCRRGDGLAPQAAPERRATWQDRWTLIWLVRTVLRDLSAAAFTFRLFVSLFLRRWVGPSTQNTRTDD
jgi:hypothetical protein